MHGRRPKPKALFPLTLVLLALAAAPAVASPAGDDDLSFSGDATAFHSISCANIVEDNIVRPLTEQAPDGTVVLAGRDSCNSEVGANDIVLWRHTPAGEPTGFGLDGDPVGVYRFRATTVTELLDLRILSDGSIVIVARTFNGVTIYEIPPAGGSDGARDFTSPAICAGGSVASTPVAGRVDAQGRAFVLWDRCEESPVVARYDADQTGSESDSEFASGLRTGEDLELTPGGAPYVLGEPPFIPTRLSPRALDPSEENSAVQRFDADLLLDSGYGDEDGGTAYVAGDPLDLEVDGQGRAYVWSTPFERGSGFRAAVQPGGWEVRRLTTGGDADGSWGAAGVARVEGPLVGTPRDPAYLLLQPDGKLLMIGPHVSDQDKAVIVRLTASGVIDPAWATAGFKLLDLNSSPGEDAGFAPFSELALQADGKVLVPFVARSLQVADRSSPRAIPAPPTGYSTNVTRLNPDPATSSTPAANPSNPLTPSAVPTICGRRAISLVRADVSGNRIKLSGLVGKRLYGKTVTIQTNYGAKASAFTKAGTVKASSTGTFTAFVAKPSARRFKGARFRAVSGSARSPQLKLPQSLTSRSVKSAAGTITVTGRVKRSVLGKRNRVTIRRLVCGRYRTVGRAKPAADGSYRIKFNATAIRGVAFYRAEAIVQVRPGAKKYAIQYARALAIKVNDQTG